MSQVIAHMTMSLDGYVADEDDGVGPLFEWYDAGALAVPSANPDITFHLDEAGASIIEPLLASVGAMVCGRRLFDLTAGWGDRHPMGAPVVVVTHRPPVDADAWPRTRFVDGVREAVEVAGGIADGKDVVIASADIAGQALDLGLIDEVAVSLVPVLMAGGRPYFGTFTRGPLRLQDPVVTSGARATHLRFRVSGTNSDRRAETSVGSL